MGVLPIEGKIKDWLHKQGYPLELKVASALQRQNLGATLANFYKDPITDQARQIDVISGLHDTTGFFRAELVIECKRSSKHPWLLLSANHSEDAYSMLFEYALSSDSGRAALVRAGGPTFASVKALPWMQWSKSRGVGLVPAFNDKGTDDAFKAVAGAMVAAIARRRELSNDETMVFIFPTVIFDNDLFECSLTDTGDIDVTKVDEARLYFPMPFGDEEGICVHIVTAAKLEEFASEARAALDELQRLLQPKAREMLDQWRPSTREE